MLKKIIHRLTWIDVPDGGGGYPASWKKGPGDYARDMFTLLVLGVAFTIGWVFVLVVRGATFRFSSKNRA